MKLSVVMSRSQVQFFVEVPLKIMSSPSVGTARPSFQFAASEATPAAVAFQTIVAAKVGTLSKSIAAMVIRKTFLSML